jgi:hypothetical protein
MSILAEREIAAKTASDLYDKIRALEKERAEIVNAFIAKHCVLRVENTVRLRVNGELRNCVVRNIDIETWYHTFTDQPVDECYPSFALELDPIGRRGEQDRRYTGIGNLKRSLYFSPKHQLWLINGQRAGDEFGVEFGVGGMSRKQAD